MNHELLTQQAWTISFLLAGLQWSALVVIGYFWLTILFFRKHNTAVGLLCILLLPFGWFVGVFVGLLFGWTRAKRWSIQTFMTSWSATIVLAIINFVLFGIMQSMSLDEWQDHFGWLPRF